MPTLRFKTNINCENCVRSVKNFLNDTRGLEDWAVDIESPDKVLTAWGDISAAGIIEVIEDAGFDAEEIEATEESVEA